MPSTKQIKNQKLFARRSKRGDFRKAISKSKKVKTKSDSKKNPDSGKKIEYEKITKIKL